MKHLTILAAVAALVCSCHHPEGNLVNEKTVTGTEEVRANEAADPRVGRGSILEAHRVRDLRALFRFQYEVDQLEKRSSCVVKYGRVTNHFEVRVPQKTTLRDLLISIGNPNYDGQARVISSNSIIQTPIYDFEHRAASNIIVHAGDLIFLQGRL
jgi:hypothetical protein